MHSGCKGVLKRLDARKQKEMVLNMKKLFAVMTLAAFTLTCPGFAQETPKEDTKKQEGKKKGKKKKTEEKKGEEKK